MEMPRKHLVLLAVVAGIGLAAAGCGGKKSASPPPASTPTTTPATTESGGTTLDGTVGPGFTISLQKGGADVTQLSPGAYVLNVDDKSDIHNFHLTGPGVDVSTDVAGQGKKTFDITLQAGKYHFQCDPHSTSLKGDFTVS